MRGARFLLCVGLAIGGAAAHADDYSSMLRYLDSTRIDGHVLSASQGISAVNMAAGEFNEQANLRAVAQGGAAQARVQPRQVQGNATSATPYDASASIAGDAYVGGRGLASINQASGSGNAQLNTVAAALATQGIREASDDSLSVDASASAGGQSARPSRTAAGGTRSAAVDASALRGFQGVLQLNQIAGSGNVTGNELLLSVQAPQR